MWVLRKQAIGGKYAEFALEDIIRPFPVFRFVILHQFDHLIAFGFIDQSSDFFGWPDQSCDCSRVAVTDVRSLVWSCVGGLVARRFFCSWVGRVGVALVTRHRPRRCFAHESLVWALVAGSGKLICQIQVDPLALSKHTLNRHHVT